MLIVRKPSAPLLNGKAAAYGSLLSWLCENSKNRKTTRIIFRNQLQPNKPAKFRRPETTLGGMLILRHRSPAVFLHNQDPKLKLGCRSISLSRAAPAKLPAAPAQPLGLVRPVLVVARMRLCARLAISESVAWTDSTYPHLQLRMKPSHSPSAQPSVFSIASPCA